MFGKLGRTAFYVNGLFFTCYFSFIQEKVVREWNLSCLYSCLPMNYIHQAPERVE